MQLDVREEAAIAQAVAATAARFGGIDILVNNASAISLTPTLATPAKRFDLMMSVNARATFLCSQACIPHLKKSRNAHILTLSPPLNMDAKWFAGHVAYTVTIDDPKAYTKPWKNERTFTLMSTEILEYSCEENNKDLAGGHIKFWTPPAKPKYPATIAR